MVKIDLITGFLGAGKTTFLKKYVSYFTFQTQITMTYFTFSDFTSECRIISCRLIVRLV